MSIRTVYGIIVFMIFSFSIKPLYAKPKSSFNSYRNLFKKKREEILKLTKKEKRAFKNLTTLENKIAFYEKKVLKLERSLKKFKIEKKRLLKKTLNLKKEIRKRKQALKELISLYWMVYIQKRERTHKDLIYLTIWGNWLFVLSLKISDDIKRLMEIESTLEGSLKEKEIIEEKIKNTTQRLIDEKDRLLDKKLFLLHEIKKIRAVKLQKEAQLNQIRKTIDESKLNSISFYKKEFRSLKGKLPWPIKGKIVYRFNLKILPPKEGIGIKTEKEIKVRSIFWGKVVFSDKLRGFGKVVIIFHGNNFYSLYAYLKESYVFVGQRVEQAEPIGIAGFCSKCNGIGVYLEIRKGKRPVDPLKWLKKI